MSLRARTWFDRVLVLLLLALVVAVGLSGYGVAILIITAGQVVPLWWRRTRPGAVLTAVALFSLAQALVLDEFMPSQLAVPIAAYSAARWGGLPTRAGAVALTVVGSMVAATAWQGPYGTTTSWISMVLLCCAITLASWALGIAGGQRDRHLDGLVERAEYVQRVAERDVELAAQDERARIAREMHDVVAHGLSVIVVQADGARYAAAKKPELAVEALETIAATGRDSLQEMRRLLGVLRTGDSGVRPQPTLADVPHLVAEAAAAGSDVEAQIVDPLPQVSDGVGLAVYRFVQEGLTNVRKHAGPDAQARVRVEVEHGVLVAEVSDDGRGAATDTGSAGSTGGLGLLGMRERIGVHGGEVDAGPRAGGGWRVSARIEL